MPFSAPTTYASQANSGYLAIFELGSAASPPVYSAVSEIKSFNPDVISMPNIDTSHLLSPNNTAEFIPGMIQPGKVSFTGNFIGDASQLDIGTKAKAQTTFPFRITAPVQRGTKTYVMTTEGFFTGYKLEFENNKAVGFTGDIQMTGTFTEQTT